MNLPTVQKKAWPMVTYSSLESATTPPLDGFDEMEATDLKLHFRQDIRRYAAMRSDIRFIKIGVITVGVMMLANLIH